MVLGKIEKMNSLTDWERELALLENRSNLRRLPVIHHLGREVEVNGKVMLNLSSNDYLGFVVVWLCTILKRVQILHPSVDTHSQGFS